MTVARLNPSGPKWRGIACGLLVAVLGLPGGLTGNEPLKEPTLSEAQRKWWAFQPLVKPVPPAVRDTKWISNEIDRFIQDRLSREGIAPSPLANKVTLIRRATLDLTGLLPTSGEIDAFLADSSPIAFEKVVDRLLASPRYGERWGRHWLDLARYADSEGFKNDEARANIWRYRDYVIDSFNQDKPYDRFIREQIAGDELYSEDPAAFIATGFNRHFPDDADARNLVQRRQEILDDITDTVGATFLGLTMGCARCHDHKFDPILQKDYYRLQAFFANVRVEDARVLEGHREYASRKAEWEAKTASVRAKLDALMTSRINSIFHVAFERYPEDVQAAFKKKPSARTPLESLVHHRSRPFLTVGAAEGSELLKSEFRTIPGIADFRRITPDGTVDGYTWIPKITGVGRVFLAGVVLLVLSKLLIFITGRLAIDRLYRLLGEIWRYLRWAAIPLGLILLWSTALYGELLWTATRNVMLKRELAKFDSLKPPDLPVGSGMIDNGSAAPSTSVLAVGVYNRPVAEVQPGFLTILDPRPAPIVQRPGSSTGRRTALANWLASPENPLTARVMANRIWHFHFGRGLVGTPNDFGMMGERPTNKDLLDWLATTFIENGWSIKKLHRLILLSHTYQQSSAFRPDAAEKDSQIKLLWRYNRRRLEGEAIRDVALQVSGKLNLKMGGPGYFPSLPSGMEVPPRWKTSEPGETHRRSVYMFVKRNTKYPMFEAFDVPSPVTSCGRRYRTVTVLQTFEMMNSEWMLDLACALAGRLLREAGSSETKLIEEAFRLAFGRAPKREEHQAISAFLDSQQKMLSSRSLKELRLPNPMPTNVDPARVASLVDVCHTLMNSHEFLYLD